MGWLIRKFRGEPLPVVAEAYAARLALQLAKSHGWTHIHVEGDCLEIIQALNDRNGERLQVFGSVIDACFELLQSFAAFKFSFIRRVGNCLAPALAYFSLLDSFVIDGISLPAVLAHVI